MVQRLNKWLYIRVHREKKECKDIGLWKHLNNPSINYRGIAIFKRGRKVDHLGKRTSKLNGLRWTISQCLIDRESAHVRNDV